MDAKLHNLLSFTIIFLSGDLNLLHQSPDYFLEKFNNYLGDKIDIKKNEEIEFFKIYKKTWKSADYKINTIFIYLEQVLNFNYLNRDKELDPYGEEDWNELDYYNGYVRDIYGDEEYGAGIKNISIKPDDYFQLFDKLIGNVDDISTIKKDGLHYILKRDIFDIYKQIMNL